MELKGQQDWYEIGVNAAKEIKIPNRSIAYIESRGFLCHELLYLFKGHIEFVETSLKQWFLKLVERILPISPTCRWYPDENSFLSQIGYEPNDKRIYQLQKDQNILAILFINYKEDYPGSPFYNYPRLDKILQKPPETRYNEKMNANLRIGLERKFTPIPISDDARSAVNKYDRAINAGLWDGFTE